MDYAEIKPGVEVYVRLTSTHEFTSRKVEYTGEVISRTGNMIRFAPHDTNVGDLMIDLDTVPEVYVIPGEPANVWLTASATQGTTTIHTDAGSLVLTAEQFEALKGLV